MSYTQRSTTDKSPFAMTYHTSTWNISTSPNTTTQTWLTSSGNGFTFTGSGYVFGFLVAEPYQNLAAVKLGDTNNPRFTWGEFIETTNSSGTRSQSDDMCIYYGNNTKHHQGAVYHTYWNSYSNTSRLNVIRMEST